MNYYSLKCVLNFVWNLKGNFLKNRRQFQQLTHWVLQGHMFCVSTMIIKIFNALLSSQMLSSFPAKQGGCYTVGHSEYSKIYLTFCAPRLLCKTHFSSLQPENKCSGYNQAQQGFKYICFQIALQWKMFYYSSQSQMNYIQLHKHFKELLWFSKFFNIFH